MKFLASLFFLLPFYSYAADQSKIVIRLEESIPIDYRSFLVANFSEDLIRDIEVQLDRGSIVTISFLGSYFEDGVEDKDDRCTVEIERTSSGGGGAKVDTKVGGAEAGGKGEKTEKIKISGPCDSVEKILKTINERN